MISTGLEIIHEAAGISVTYKTSVGVTPITAVPRTIRPELRVSYDQRTLAKSKIWEIRKSAFQEKIADAPVIGDCISETIGTYKAEIWEVLEDPVTGHCYQEVGGGSIAFRIFTLRKAE